MRPDNDRDLYSLEQQLRVEGKKPLCGVDEAGRGPLAGPVCAAAVILPPGFVLPELNDSKKLSPRKREQLYERITEAAVSYGIAFATVEEIERLNILQATFLAMNRAIAQLDPPAAYALIDGNRNKEISIPSQAIVGGDGCCASIAAASILAKVTRDRYMLELHERYPAYGFDRHKGYGTKAHYEALRAFGPTPQHRLSFLKNMH
jgi:ribonuclease HII